MMVSFAIFFSPSTDMADMTSHHEHPLLLTRDDIDIYFLL